MTKTREPIVRISDVGRTVAVVGDIYRFLATGEDTDGKYAMWEAIVPPGSGPPPHVHSREEEGFFVLEGEVTFQVGDDRIVAKAGTFANMPIGTPHSFKNKSNATCTRPLLLENDTWKIAKEANSAIWQAKLVFS